MDAVIVIAMFARIISNKNINPKYSKSWGAYKKTLSSYSLDGTIPDLFLSGKFHKNIKATFKTTNSVFLESKTPYTPFLLAKYGSKILSLAPRMQSTYNALIYKKTKEKLNKLWTK